MPLPFNTSFVRLLINNTQYQYKSFTDKNHQKIEASFHPTFSKKLEAIINIIILPHFLIITFRIEQQLVFVWQIAYWKALSKNPLVSINITVLIQFFEVAFCKKPNLQSIICQSKKHDVT